MGRPTEIDTIKTDGTKAGYTTFTYNANDVLRTLQPAPTGENAKSWQYEYDALGRLTSVCEITSTANGGGSCGQTSSQTGYWTEYTYDALNDVTKVVENAQSSTTQTRNYGYDQLGRMTSETNPESGTSSYTYDSDSSGACPATAYNGDMVKRLDAIGNVTCYAYDALHRVTAITYPGITTPEKHFKYDNAASNCTSPAYTFGRLAEAYTGPSSGKITDLALCYSARGETTDTYTWTQNSGGWFHANVTYRQVPGMPDTLALYNNAGALLTPTIYYGAGSRTQ